MISHTMREIAEAAEEEEGFCLACGSRQQILESRFLFGPCEDCYATKVIPAALILKVIPIIAPEDFEGLIEG